MVIQTLQDARSLAEKKKWRTNKISGNEGKRMDAQVKRRDGKRKMFTRKQENRERVQRQTGRELEHDRKREERKRWSEEGRDERQGQEGDLACD